jgi:hypothetical protein
MTKTATETPKFRRINGSGSSIFWAEGTRWATVRDPSENIWAVVKMRTTERPVGHNEYDQENVTWCNTRDQAQREIVRQMEREAKGF